MGGSSAQTVGYWYHPTFMLGLHQGPCDAFLRFRAADVDAWAGELTASGTITINKPDLWGGIDSEGGIQGDVEVCFGEADQGTSAYYDSVFGEDPSAHRGDVRLIFKGESGYGNGPWGTKYRLGRFGAMNPYPKPVATLTRRILKGWDNDACWYPEKAPIGVDGTPSGPAVEWLLVTLGGSSQVLKTSPDGWDWSAAATSVPVVGGSAWSPNGAVSLLVHAGQALGVATSAGAGSESIAFRATDGTWYAVDWDPISSSSGRQVHSGSHWFIVGHAGSTIQSSPAPATTAFTSLGVGHVMQDGCRIGDRVLFAYATGSSFDIVEFRHYAADGTGMVNPLPGDLHTGYQARYATVASDGVTALLTLKEETGGPGSDWRVRLHSSPDVGGTWTDHGAPFPYSSGAFSPRRVNALHDATLGRWFVASHNRVAIGETPAGITLDPFVFPREINGIASDGEKVVVCGEAGMLYAWTPVAGWQELDSGTTANLLAVAALGSVTPGVPGTLLGMNPAHVIYDSLVAESMQGEPVSLVNDASFRAGADTLYRELFGICTDYDPDHETCEEFRQRICNLIGAQCSRSTVDGLWYLDIARGDYDVDALPVLTDDDILEFACDPSTLDDAVNQVAVRWFDPMTKQERTTAPVHALGAIHAMGGIVPEIVNYPEIPFEPLADRCAARDLQAKATPTKRFTLTTNRVPYAWRRGTYFRLQAPKRGIADMVCLVGEINRGTLRSGAIRLVAMQDVYSMPATSYVVGQPPIEGGTQVPVPVEHQVAFEAPYVELAGTIPAAELAALDVDTGFVQVVGVRPAVGINYQLRTRPAGSEYDIAGSFDWCPSALVDEATDDPTQGGFTLSGGSDLAAVAMGSAALWGSELVRVDALDIETGDVVFGRACGDTVPQAHAAGERVYFYDAWAGTDQVEYVTGETMQAKLLTRTGNAMLDEGDAAELSVEMDQRAARPYPPARIRLNALAAPALLPLAVTAEWAWRDRVLQADQLVDNEAASIGPEAGTTATVRWYLDEVLVQTHTGVSGTSQAYTFAADGWARVEIESVRDGLTSWQAQVREFYVSSADILTTEGGTELVALEDGTPISLE